MAGAHKMRKVTATRNISKTDGVAKPEMDVNKWSSLARDPLNRIFSFFNPVDIILIIPFVCKYWGRIFLEHLFCKENNNCLDFGPLSNEPLYSLFYELGDENSRAVTLMNLLVAVMHAFASDEPSDADDNTRVTPITEIRFPSNLRLHDKHLVYLAERCPELQTLLLPCARNLTGIGISRATRFWSQMKWMMYAPFTWKNQHATDIHLPRIVEEFGLNCKNLDALALGGFHFHWQSSAHIARNLKSLKKLQLIYAVISKYGLQIFLSRCKNLDELIISCCISTKGERINHAKIFSIYRHQEGPRIRWSTDLYPDKAGECYTPAELVNIIWQPTQEDAEEWRQIMLECL